MQGGRAHIQAAGWLETGPASRPCHPCPPHRCSPLYPLNPSSALQFHRNQDYPVQRPTLFLRQFLHAASRLLITVAADPLTEEEAEAATEEQLDAAAQR